MTAFLKKSDVTTLSLTPYLWYHLNDASGANGDPVIDSSTNGFDGTCVTISGYNDAQFPAGKLNNAYSLPGEAEALDYISGGDIANFDWNEPFSVDCWVQPQPGYEFLSLCGRFSAGEEKGWMIYIQDRYIVFQLIGNYALGNYIQVYSSAQVPSDYDYHHIVVTYNGNGTESGVKFYLDNVLLTNSALANALGGVTTLNTGTFYVASRADSVWGFIGQIDEFAIYEKAISATEVNYRYNAGTGIETMPSYINDPAYIIKFGPFLDSSDGITPLTGLTIAQADIRLSKNGGNIAQKHGVDGATHDELGYYDFPIDVSDVDTAGELLIVCNMAGALPVWERFIIIDSIAYNTFLSGTDDFNVNVVKVSNVSQTAKDLGAQLDVATSTRMAAASYVPPDNTNIGLIKTETDKITSVKAKTDLISVTPAGVGAEMALTSAERTSVANTLFDQADGIESGWTLRKVIRIIFSALAGKLSGATTTNVTMRDIPDTKVRISATVDVDGNRSAVTLNGD